MSSFSYSLEMFTYPLYPLWFDSSLHCQDHVLVIVWRCLLIHYIHYGLAHPYIVRITFHFDYFLKLSSISTSSCSCDLNVSSFLPSSCCCGVNVSSFLPSSCCCGLNVSSFLPSSCCCGLNVSSSLPRAAVA